MGCFGRRLWLGTAGAFVCVLAACSTTPELDFATSPDTTLSADASSTGDGSNTQTSDGSTPIDPGSDGGGTDGNASNDSGTGNDASDGGGGYLCGTTRVADCSQCATGNFLCAATGSCTSDCKANCGGSPLECVACNNGGQPAARVCEPVNAAAACITGNLQRCACTGNSAATCFGPRQVCVANQCTACGETMTNDKTCTGGGKCTEGGGNRGECN